MRWNELSPAWQACLEETWAAYCTGTVPVGAVVVNPAGQIVSRGRNRIRDDSAPPPQTYDNQLAHAELNALLSIRLKPRDIHDYAIYTAVEPCPLCMGAIYMSGVRQIYYATEDAYAGATDLLGKTWYLSHKPVRAFGPQRGGLAEFACALHVEYNLRVHQPPYPVVEREREVFPQGVALGEALIASGEGARWRETLSIQEAFDAFTAFSENQVNHARK